MAIADIMTGIMALGKTSLPIEPEISRSNVDFRAIKKE
jgi:hypothetical protein